MKLIKSILIFTLSFTFILSQDDFSDDTGADTAKPSTLSGVVTDEGGSALAGANIVVDGTDLGAASDEDGQYSIESVDAGASVTVSMIGYEDVTAYADSEELNFTMIMKTLEMSELEVLASRAGATSAVAYTDINKEDINLRLGSRDIPLALETVPSVYATGQGGGAGDARINVRGFNQRNVAIMINGIPVNDMENGWVYWSNWDGVADVTTSIQLQKGLSAQNLATPSIGGSMNVITDAAKKERGGSFKQEVGAWGFLKSTLSYHSGLMMDNKLAVSGTLVKKTGKGHGFGTWTDAYAYFLGGSYNMSDKHKFQFYALGAPQRHGQNLYRMNIAAYDRSFASSLEDYYADATEVHESGRDFNGTASVVSSEAAALLGDQQFQMYSEYKGDRHEDNLINERENFFHKPQMALNHYWAVNEDINVVSSAYWSGGMGGGTGTYGSMEWDYTNLQRIVDYNATILENDSLGASSGILRNSNNRQSTLGLLSKVNYTISDNLKTQFGIDARAAKIYHVKTIRDLLGGDKFITSDSEFSADNGDGGLGDPIDYNYTNYVNWLGLFGQVEYSQGDLTTFLMGGLTTVKYEHWNHFKDADNYSASYISSKDASDAEWVEGLGDANGGHENDLYIEADPITTFQIKGGVHYNIGGAMSVLNVIPIVGKLYDQSEVWFNFGLIDKAPIFDQVIQDWDAKMSTNPENEKFTAFEFGLNTNSNDGTMAAKFNVYSTTWADRIATRTVINEDGDDDIIYLTGINQSHSGVELELSMQINEMFRLDFGSGIGNWYYTDDATGTYRNSDGEDESYSYSIKDLKVGDSPQASISAGLTVAPVEDAQIQLLYNFYAFHYSDWSPTSRSFSAGDVPDRVGSWKTPTYGVLNLNARYKLPFIYNGITSELTLNVRNLLDEVYIQDATDNSRYNAYPFRVNNHKANAAEVYLGLPTAYNLGISFKF
jgi:iron complex outermembrane recepter protein